MIPGQFFARGLGPTELSPIVGRYTSSCNTILSAPNVNRSPGLSSTADARTHLRKEAQISTESTTTLSTDQQRLWTEDLREKFQLQSNDAGLLLSVLTFFDPAGVSISVLEEGYWPQNRWDEDGNIQAIQPTSVGLNWLLVSLISDQTRFQQAIDCLCASSMLKIEQKQQSISVQADIYLQVQESMEAERQVYWKNQALLLICHAFPRDRLSKLRYMNN